MLKLLVISAMLYGVSGDVLDDRFFATQATFRGYTAFIYVRELHLIVPGAIIKENAVLASIEIETIPPSEILVGVGVTKMDIESSLLIEVDHFYKHESMDLGAYGLAILFIKASIHCYRGATVIEILSHPASVGKAGIVTGWNHNDSLLYRDDVEIVDWNFCRELNLHEKFYICVKVSPTTVLDVDKDVGLLLTTYRLPKLVGIARAHVHGYLVFANVQVIFEELSINVACL